MPAIKPGTHAIDFGGGNVLWLGDDNVLYCTPRSAVGGNNAQTTLASSNSWFELDVGEINPTVGPADYTLTLPKGCYFIALAWRIIQTRLDGTLTSSAVGNVGNDPSRINIVAAGAAGIFGTLANINTAPTGVKQYNNALNSLNAAIPNLVSTDIPFVLQVTTAAVLNTATIYRVRCFVNGIVIPVPAT